MPAPVLPAGAFPEGRAYTTRWNGFVGSIPLLAEAAPAGGFLNVVLDGSVDGVVRSVPLIARYEGKARSPATTNRWRWWSTAWRSALRTSRRSWPRPGREPVRRPWRL